MLALFHGYGAVYALVGANGRTVRRGGIRARLARGARRGRASQQGAQQEAGGRLQL